MRAGRRKSRIGAASLWLLLPAFVATSGTAGAQSRVEFHMLPPISTGPMHPEWSPDGEWIAFAMRGDIWKVPSGGGEAIALTAGPAYHFEPAWSPDGSRIALTYGTDGDLEVGVVSANGGAVQQVSFGTAGYDLQPAWNADGTAVYFASRRSGNFDIYRVGVDADGRIAAPPSPWITGPGNQYQPAVSPDGSRIAFISGVPGRGGSGGIWVLTRNEDGSRGETGDTAIVGPGEVHLALYEETSYRVEPVWSADGSMLYYSSDAAGSNDIAVVPAAGGNRVRLTEDPLDEFSVAASPDGRRVAFVSNHDGPTRLYTMTATGGARSSWREVEISSRRGRAPTGVLRGELRGPGAEIMPGRIMLLASDGRAYTEDGGFHRMTWFTRTHYAHTDGTFEIEVPAGRVTIDAMRGFEYAPDFAAVDVPAGGVAEVTLQLERITDPMQGGWYSGDMHVHDLHEGRFGLTQDMFFRQLEADDVRVANALIHMDGTKLMGRWDDLTGEPYRLSTDERILYYTQEFRGSYGHVALLGLQRFITPLIGGARGTPYAPDVLKLRHIDAAHQQGGIAGFVHPYNGPVDTPQRAAAADIPIHVALGRGDFFDVVSVASLELESAEIYYRLLNCGFRIAATGGTDNFSDVWLDPSGGTARTYAHLQGTPPLTFGAWLDAIRAGRTFGTSGPLLFLSARPSDPRGVWREPGDEIRLDGDDTTLVDVGLDVASVVPIDRVEIVANGEIVHAWNIDTPANDRGVPQRFHWRLEETIELPEGGWVTARAVGPESRYVGDGYAFAQTSPVYFVRDGVTFTSAADARFLLETIEVIRERAQRRDSWNTDTERAEYLGGIDEARAMLRRIIDGGR